MKSRKNGGCELMKNKGLKLSVINIAFSGIVFIFGITAFIFSFFIQIGVIHLIFAVIDILWIIFNFIRLFNYEKSKIYKLLMTLVLLWCFLLAINIIFVFCGIFIEYAAYSSVVLIFILVLLYHLIRSWWWQDDSKLIDSFEESPIGMILILLALIPVWIIIDDIKTLKRINKKKSNKSNTE